MTSDLLLSLASLTLEREAADLAADTRKVNYLDLQIADINHALENAALRSLVERQGTRLDLLTRAVTALYEMHDITEKYTELREMFMKGDRDG